jgi:hypothetical protein
MGCRHVLTCSNRGEQMVRYYDYYSNVFRGNRQKEKTDIPLPCIIECGSIFIEQVYKKRVHSGIPYLSPEEFEVIVQDELERQRLGQIALKFHD